MLSASLNKTFPSFLVCAVSSTGWTHARTFTVTGVRVLHNAHVVQFVCLHANVTVTRDVEVYFTWMISSCSNCLGLHGPVDWHTHTVRVGMYLYVRVCVYMLYRVYIYSCNYIYTYECTETHTHIIYIYIYIYHSHMSGVAGGGGWGVACPIFSIRVHITLNKD